MSQVNRMLSTPQRFRSRRSCTIKEPRCCKSLPCFLRTCKSVLMARSFKVIYSPASRPPGLSCFSRPRASNARYSRVPSGLDLFVHVIYGWLYAGPIRASFPTGASRKLRTRGRLSLPTRLERARRLNGYKSAVKTCRLLALSLLQKGSRFTGSSLSRWLRRWSLSPRARMTKSCKRGARSNRCEPAKRP